MAGESASILISYEAKQTGVILQTNAVHRSSLYSVEYLQLSVNSSRSVTTAIASYVSGLAPRNNRCLIMGQQRGHSLASVASPESHQLNWGADEKVPRPIVYAY